MEETQHENLVHILGTVGHPILHEPQGGLPARPEVGAGELDAQRVLGSEPAEVGPQLGFAVGSVLEAFPGEHRLRMGPQQGIGLRVPCAFQGHIILAIGVIDADDGALLILQEAVLLAARGGLPAPHA